MSLTQQQIDENIRKMKAETSKKKEILQSKGAQSDDLDDNAVAARKIKYLEDQLASAKKEIDNANNERDRVSEQLDNIKDEKTMQRDSAAMDEIISGSSVKKFEKDYTFKAKDQDIKFHVTMHGPNISELAKINAMALDLNDYSDYSEEMDNGLKNVFRAIASFIVLGDNVPDWFKSTDSYRLDILMYVYEDFSNWYDTFLTTQLQ